jgi:glycine cleavage system H protein
MTRTTAPHVIAAVADDPGLVNSDPYGAGRLFKLRVATLPDLLDADSYRALAGSHA